MRSLVARSVFTYCAVVRKLSRSFESSVAAEFSGLGLWCAACSLIALLFVNFHGGVKICRVAE